jgi:hypothetical protein
MPKKIHWDKMLPNALEDGIVSDEGVLDGKCPITRLWLGCLFKRTIADPDGWRREGWRRKTSPAARSARSLLAGCV